jgi:tetratricopeptide (TPR) repeat protein
MSLVDLPTAVGEIVQASRDDLPYGNPHPFIFMLGAGVSTPSIPLAAGIVDMTMRRARELGRTDPAPGTAAIDAYSYWFERAFPNARQRQRFLRGLMERTAISPASLRLAHLILSDFAANVVVTTNFDDFVSRALTLFGKPHVVCDHPATVERIDPESRDVQIVHVHGSYWFYDCVNLKAEIESRAASSSQNMTMASLLDSLLARRSPLVIGYAGWEGDVMMAALARRLRRTLPYNVYWFCYRRGDVDALPEWLRSHPQVKFVVPAERLRRRGPEVETKVETREPAAPTLSAQRVLEALIGGFNVETPALTRDPVGFFAGALRASLCADSEADLPDIYNIREVIKDVERAAALYRQAASAAAANVAAARAQDLSSTLFRQVLDAVRRSQFDEAIASGIALPEKDLARAERIELMRALRTAGDSVDDLSARIRADDRIVTIGDTLDGGVAAAASTVPPIADAPADEVSGYNAEPTALVAGLLAKALIDKGLALSRLNRAEEALASYQQAIRRLGDADGFDSREQLARALAHTGLSLAKLSRRDEALAAYDEVLRRYRGDNEPALQRLVAKTLVNKGATLMALSQREEAAAAYREVVQLYGDQADPELLEEVARALLQLANVLEALGRRDEEVGTYDEAVRRFADAHEPALRQLAATAMLNKGVALSGLARIDAALAAYEDVVKRFGHASEPNILRLSMMALINEAAMLRRLKRFDEALAIYDDVARRLADAADARLRQLVALAMLHRGNVLRQRDRMQEAIDAYDEILRRFAETPDGRSWDEVASAAFYKGKALAAQSRAGDARAMFQSVIDRFAAVTEPGVPDTVAAARHALAELDAADSGATT